MPAELLPLRDGALPSGRIVLLVVVLVNVAIVELMFVTAAPAKNTLVAIGQWLGLHAALIMIFQLVMVARIPWLDRRIGMDKLTKLHRYTGLTLFWVVLLHPTFVMLGYAEHDNAPFTKEFTNLAGNPRHAETLAQLKKLLGEATTPPPPSKED